MSASRVKQVGDAHGSAVAIGDCGVLILGASGAGKSAFAARLLIAGHAAGLSCRLIGDDRILVLEEDGRFSLRPHPAIAGLFALRGYPIAKVAHRPSCRLKLVIRICAKDRAEDQVSAFPALRARAQRIADLPAPMLQISEIDAAAARKILMKIENFATNA